MIFVQTWLWFLSHVPPLPPPAIAEQRQFATLKNSISKQYLNFKIMCVSRFFVYGAPKCHNSPPTRARAFIARPDRFWPKVSAKLTVWLSSKMCFKWSRRVLCFSAPWFIFVPNFLCFVPDLLFGLLSVERGRAVSISGGNISGATPFSVRIPSSKSVPPPIPDPIRSEVPGAW